MFHAVNQSATECTQQLWRYRPNVPIHVCLGGPTSSLWLRRNQCATHQGKNSPEEQDDRVFNSH
ncbi:MAG: hypothetical protein V7K89_23595 [Nostoc sp.]